MSMRVNHAQGPMMTGYSLCGALRVACIMIATIVGGLQAQEAPRTDLSQARGFFARGDYASAREILERLSKSKGATAEVHSLLGFVYLEVLPLHPEKAEQSFRRSLALNPQDLYGNYGAARLMTRSGQAAASLAFFRRAVAIAPKYPQLRHDYGVALFGLGRLREAWKEFRSSTSLPSSVEYLAIIEAKRERHNVAAGLIKRLIDKLGPASPERPRLLYQMGAFLVMASQNEAALPVLAASVEGGFEKVEALNELARMYYEAGQVDDAFALWTRATKAESFRGSEVALARSGHAAARFNLGLVHFKRKNYPEARRELEAAIDLQKCHPNAWYKLGQTLQRLKEREKAKEAFAFHRRIQPLHQKRKSAERSLVNDPSNLKNRLGYAKILLALEEPKSAFDQLRILEQAQSDYPGLIELMAKACEETGRVGLAKVYRDRLAAEAKVESSGADR